LVPSGVEEQYLSSTLSQYLAGNCQAALPDIRRALAVEEPAAWALLAACYADKPSLARLVIEVAREESAVTPSLEIVDGTLWLTLNRRAEAEAAFSRALALSPGNADALAGLKR
jgi:Flp pilus assembly protein TadD